MIPRYFIKNETSGLLLCFKELYSNSIIKNAFPKSSEAICAVRLSIYISMLSCFFETGPFLGWSAIDKSDTMFRSCANDF